MKSFPWLFAGMLLGAVLWQQAPGFMRFASDQPPLNYLPFSDCLLSGGQPSAGQFHYLQQQGVDVVINLLPADSVASLENEAYLVAAKQMKYVNIPVAWNDPQAKDFEFFADILQSNKDKTFFVHCQLNMRASVFVYLYRVIYQQADAEMELDKVHQVWLPSERWQLFMGQVLGQHGMSLPVL